jgi:hypothetical protein
MTTNTPVNLAWPLLTAKDGSDNGITYSYGKKVVSGSEVERWLSKIRYGHLSRLDRHVSFAYDDRPDKSFGWMHGVKRQSTKLLISVSIYGQDGAHWARFYKLAYVGQGAATSGSGRSKLASITECGSIATECLRPTEFTWAYGGMGFQGGVKQSMALPSSSSAMIIAADLNGDGRTDFAYPEKNSGETRWKYVLSQPSPAGGIHYSAAKNAAAITSFPGVNATAYPLDYDLDGKTDLIPRGTGTLQWMPILSRGSDGGYHQIYTYFHGPLPRTSDDAHALFGDFNGDGLQDVLEGEYYDHLNKWVWFVRLRTGKVSASIDNTTNPVDLEAFDKDGERKPLNISVADPTNTLVLDINGDGRDEIVFLQTGLVGTVVTLDALVNVPTQFLSLPWTIFNLDIKLADLNGDGLVDLISNGNGSTSDPGTTLYYWLNTGRGFSPPVQIGGISVGSQRLKAAQVVDVNADGRFELLIPRATSNPTFEPVYIGMDLLQSSFSTAGEFVFTIGPAANINFPDGLTIDDLQKQGVRIVDADGNGYSDLVAVDRAGHSTSSSVLLFKANPDKGDRLTHIYEGNRMPFSANAVPPSVKITYAPLTDPSVYASGACARVEGMSCAHGTPMMVVKMVERDSGLTGADALRATAVSEYRYTTGRFDKKTRGFAGFAEVAVTSYGLQDGVVSGAAGKRSFYTNTVAGQPPRLYEEWMIANLPGGKQALKRTSTSWTKQVVGPTYFEYVSQAWRGEYELPIHYNLSMSPQSFDSLGLT